MAHVELELHQNCLNHLNGCQEKNIEHIMYKLINLNRISRQWYVNIVEIITSLWFKENDINLCIYFEICIKKKL